MTLSRTALVALALLSPALAATSAVAQPSATPPAATAPAATPAPVDPDISQINGQLVKVGEHNEYHYGFKRWNVSANPVGWMLGIYGASVSYGVNQNVAVRGDVNYFNPVDSGVDGVEIGVGVPIYFRRTYQGVFLEPGFISRRITGYGSTSTTAGPQMLVGWHWLWDSGLNVSAAFGVGRNWSTADGENHYDDPEVFGNGYLRFGYAF